MIKHVMIPESYYKGLLNFHNHKDHENIDHAKEKLQKIKEDQYLNASSKNALYNQELPRYLKMRNTELNKPVKVEISSGAKILTKADTDFKPLVFDSEGNLNSIGKETVGIAQSVSASDAELDKSFFARKSHTTQGEMYEDYQKKLARYIISNPDTFHVTPDGGVIANPEKGTKKVGNSDVLKISQYLLGNRSRRPAGTIKIIDRGHGDEKYLQLLSKARKNLAEKGQSRFRSASSSLVGSGFKPEKWY